MPPTDVPAALSPLGLRERKKIRTRAAIQRHALHLFQAQGYAPTTMDQIATAADISPSTLYRYFPTKEDLVLNDDYDPVLAANFRSQPAALSPLEALRAAILEVIASIPPQEREDFQFRFQLTFSVPEVRAKALNHLLETSDLLAHLFAERATRHPDDFPIRVLAGSVVGAILAAQTRWLAEPHNDLSTIITEAMDLLLAGPTMLTTPTPDSP